MSIVKKIICLLLVMALCVSLGGCKKKKKQIVIVKRPASQVTDATDNSVDDETESDEISEEVYESFRELAEKNDTTAPREKEYTVEPVSFSLSDEY